MAVHYGADAVYLAGRRYGMRAAAGNFSDEELISAVAYCHERSVRVHVTCNTLPREDEISALPAFLELVQHARADALIIADMGVMRAARKYAPCVPLHVSTQMGVVNSEAAAFLHDLGASCVVLARELSLDEIARIRANAPDSLQLEAFVHGAMCVSFSGRCLLSNFMTGRDANRGECAQPCRWKYRLYEEQRPGEAFEITENGGTHILNSRDMCMIEHLPELMDAGVDVMKIEGRMKSAYYTAAVTNAYRHTLDAAMAGRQPDSIWIDEVVKVSHRPYSTGFYFGEPGQSYSSSMYSTRADVCAIVEACEADGTALLTQRNKFSAGDVVELLTNSGPPAVFTVSQLLDGEGNKLESAPHPMMRLRMQLPRYAEPLSIVRKLK